MARYTIKQFKAEYPDDNACLDTVFKNRYGRIKWCPKCGAETKFYRVKKRQSYACMHCGYQLYPLANTIFRKTTTPLWNWFYAIYLFSVAKNGVSAKELERQLGVTYKTAWRMAKQIRLLMAQDDDKLIGIVEVDETYIGGKTIQAKSYDNKTPVVGLAEKRGKLKAKVLNANWSAINPYINANVDSTAVIHTDDSRIYHRLKQNYKHLQVDHGVGRYVHNGIHTNNIEGFWSLLKTSWRGTYRYVSPKYMDLYISEFVFRHNNRFEPICPLLLAKV